jgi:hypothetical protein
MTMILHKSLKNYSISCNIADIDIGLRRKTTFVSNNGRREPMGKENDCQLFYTTLTYPDEKREDCSFFYE